MPVMEAAPFYSIARNASGISPQLASDDFSFVSVFCNSVDISVFQLSKNESIALIPFFVISSCLRSYHAYSLFYELLVSR